MVEGIIFLLFLGSLIWVYKDAKNRNKKSWLATLLVAILFWPLSVVVWLLFRSKKLFFLDNNQSIEHNTTLEEKKDLVENYSESQPQSATSHSLRKRKKIILVISGLIPLLGLTAHPPTAILLTYSCFVLVYFKRAFFGRIVESISLSLKRKFILVVLVVSLGVLEFFSWLNSFLSQDPHPGLLHPQLIPDLLLAFGFYLGWVIAWWLLLRKYKFSLKEVFIVNGLAGMTIEGNGAVFLSGLATLPFGLLLWLIVFLAYGSTLGIVYLLIGNQVNFNANLNGRKKYILAFLYLLIIPIITTLIWTLLVQNFLPPKGGPARL